MEVTLQKDNIKQVLLFDDGLVNHVIYLLKDGTAKSCTATTATLANIANTDLHVTSVVALNG